MQKMKRAQEKINFLLTSFSLSLYKVHTFIPNILHMKITSLDEIDSWVQEWMQREWVGKIIAISGWSSAEKMEWADPDIVKQYNDSIAAYVNAIIEGTLKRLQDYRVAILTWGTEWWVPEDAIRIAKDYGFPTIGVYPARGAKSALSDALINCAIEVKSIFWESRWGDETPVFAKLADASVVLGGGAWTLIEVAHALKINEGLISKWLRPKYIIPVTWLPGMSSLIQLLPAKKDVKKFTFPEHEIKTGQQVADFLERKLNLEDDHKENDRRS